MRRNAPPFTAAAAILLLSACQQTQDRSAQRTAEAESAALYFHSAEHAVQRTAELLRAGDWATLARYYDLSTSDVDPASLESGDYFFRERPPEGRHPGLPWQYERPFNPVMRFEDEEPTDRPGVVRVRVGIEIDQGGGPPQRGFETFLLRRSERGYQLLPGEPGDVSSAPPASSQSAAPSADISLLRPHLGASVGALPPAAGHALPALLAELVSLQRGDDAGLPPPASRPAPNVPGVEAYNPTDRELLVSEVGRRIELVLESEPVADVAAALERKWTGPMQLRYERIDIRCEDHAGTGRLCYALAPEPRLVNLPRAKTPH